MDCGRHCCCRILAFAGVSVGYGIKIFTASAKVAAEFKHPIAGNLFGTFFISLLLLPILIAPVNLLAARTIWAIAAGAMLVFAWVIVNRWVGAASRSRTRRRAWIVPVVGLLDVPLAIPSLDLAQFHGLMVFALAVGLFFAIPLFTLIFSSLIFELPMPDALRPSLLILAAPFAVGFSAYSATAKFLPLPNRRRSHGEGRGQDQQRRPQGIGHWRLEDQSREDEREKWDREEQANRQREDHQPVELRKIERGDRERNIEQADHWHDPRRRRVLDLLAATHPPVYDDPGEDQHGAGGDCPNGTRCEQVDGSDQDRQ